MVGDGRSTAEGREGKQEAFLLVKKEAFFLVLGSGDVRASVDRDVHDNPSVFASYHT